MMRSKTVILSLVVLMILSATAFAQQRGRAVVISGVGAPAGTQQGPGPEIDAKGPLGPIVHCFAAIGLTDAQKADLKALIEAELPTLQALHDTVKADEEAVKAAVEATPPDACAVGTAVLKMHGDREAVRTELESLQTKVEALLTTEQKLKLAGCLAGLAPPKP